MAGAEGAVHVIATGSPAARDVGTLVGLALADGWDVRVTVSPDGRRFADVDALAAQTGKPVLSAYDEVLDPVPVGDVVIAAPITCNSLAKWAAGISDTLALGLLVEAVGLGRPVVAMPFSHWGQIGFPAVQEAMARLADWGVTLVVGDALYAPRRPEPHPERIRTFPWRLDVDRFPWQLAWQAAVEQPLRPRRPASGRSAGGRSPAAAEAGAIPDRRPRR